MRRIQRDATTCAARRPPPNLLISSSPSAHTSACSGALLCYTHTCTHITVSLEEFIAIVIKADLFRHNNTHQLHAGCWLGRADTTQGRRSGESWVCVACCGESENFWFL